MFFTTGELPMNDSQRQALLDFVRGGGGFLGVHSATDTFYQWPEYGKLIGGYFDQHPWHQAVRIDVADRSDPLVAFIGPSIALSDEIYSNSAISMSAARTYCCVSTRPRSISPATSSNRHPYGWPLAWTPRRRQRTRVLHRPWP